MEDFKFNFGVIFNFTGEIVIQTNEKCCIYKDSTLAATDLISLIENEELIGENSPKHRVIIGTDKYDFYISGEFFKKTYMLLKGESIHKFIHECMSTRCNMGRDLHIACGKNMT